MLVHITIIIIICIISTSQHRLHSLLTVAKVNDVHSETWNSRIPSSPRCAGCHLCTLCASTSSQASSRNSSMGKIAPRLGLFIREVTQEQGPRTTSTCVDPCSCVCSCFSGQNESPGQEAAGQQEVSSLKEDKDMNVSWTIVLWQHQENYFLIKLMNVLVIWTQESWNHTPSHWILPTHIFPNKPDLL